MVDYATVEELREQIDKVGSDSDQVLALLVTAASRSIDRRCNRPDGFQAASTATARLFSGSGTGVLWIDECAAVTLVEVRDSPTDTTYTAWASTDWIAACGEPRFPDFNRLPYQFLLADPSGDQAVFYAGRFSSLRGFKPGAASMRGLPTVRVTAKWGYALVVPEPITQATITQAARWFKRGESSWSDTLGNPDTGQMMFRKALDPDIQHLLVAGRYVRPAIVR